MLCFTMFCSTVICDVFLCLYCIVLIKKIT